MFRLSGVEESRVAIMALMDSGLVVIKSLSSGCYLHSTGSAEKNVFNPYTKIEVEKAKTDIRFVHLRFFHSNKYLALRGPHTINEPIAANTKQPQEDRSKWSCTMFEPTVINGRDFYLRHVQSGGHLATFDEDFHVHVDVNAVNQDHLTPLHAFRFVDWDTLVMLPKNVAFKGDNDKFLKLKRFWFLEFSSEDSNEEAASYEVTMQPDGSVRLQSVSSGKFWRRKRQVNWIWAKSTDTVGKNKNTLFWPVKVNDDTIALKSAGDNSFCQRGMANYLEAGATSIITEAKFKVQELVLERNIYDVSFQMADVRIFNETRFVAGTGSATNNDPRSPSSLAVKVSYQDVISSTFQCSLSLKTGVKTIFTTGIPCIVEGKIEVSAEVTTSLEWNTTSTQTKIQEVTFTVIVPPLSTVRVDYVGKKGTCSVPFSYTQRERLSRDGSIVTSSHIDGIYTGVNYYSFHFDQVAVEHL